MLGFNLGVFFKNLSGAPVYFSAQVQGCEFVFIGAVTDLRQEHGWQGSITVTLRHGPLACTILFDEAEEAEHPDANGVQVTLFRDASGDETAPLQLISTSFRFKDVTLHPMEPVPDPEPPRSA